MSKEDFVPDGFVPLSQFDGRTSSKEGHSDDYKLLRQAANDGEISSFQIGGSKRWYVNKKQATSLLASQAAKRPKALACASSKQPNDLQHEPVCKLPADVSSSLASVVGLLERIAVAVESIATQPVLSTADVLDVISTNSFNN